MLRSYDKMNPARSQGPTIVIIAELFCDTVLKSYHSVFSAKTDTDRNGDFYEAKDKIENYICHNNPIAIVTDIPGLYWHRSGFAVHTKAASAESF